MELLHQEWESRSEPFTRCSALKRDRGVLSLDDYSLYATIVTAALSIAVGILAYTAVAWFQWQRKLYLNTLALRSSNRYAPKWVTLGWLVPVACFFVPKRMVDDAYFPSGRPGGVSTDLITAWWGMGWSAVALVAITTGPSQPMLRIVSAVFLILVSTVLISVTLHMVERVSEGQALRFLSFDPSARIKPISVRSASSSATLGLLVTIAGAAFTVLIAIFIGFDSDGPTAPPVPIADLPPAACFDGVVDDGVVHVTDCDTFHDGQLLGSFRLASGAYAGPEATATFSTRQCRDTYELFSGIASDPLPTALSVVTPDEAAWASDIRDGYCVLGGLIEGVPMRFSAQHPPSRVPLERAQSGRCYERDAGFITLRPTECSETTFLVHTVVQLTLLVDAPYPSNISSIVAESCPPPNTSFLPTEQQWREGYRHVLCAR